MVTESSRRILWIVGLYRAVCGALLLGAALFVNLRVLAISTPNAFVTAAGLYFLYGLLSFLWVQRDSELLPLPALLLSLLVGDLFFLALLIYSGGSAGAPLSILLFPQLAASGWLMRTQVAFFHAALTSLVLVGLDASRMLQGQIPGAQLFQTGLVGFGYFATVGIALALGRYTKASEDLAAQRSIDVANLEQVNRLIIQDMQDGVLVVDLNGVVRGHNAQVTRLLGGFGRMRGGMRLAEFSSTLHDYWRRWQEDFAEPLPPFRVERTQRLLRVRLVRIQSWWLIVIARIVWRQRLGHDLHALARFRLRIDAESGRQQLAVYAAGLRKVRQFRAFPQYRAAGFAEPLGQPVECGRDVGGGRAKRVLVDDQHAEIRQLIMARQGQG